MNRETTIEVAKRAGAFLELSTTPEKDIAFLMRFAALVAAAERDRLAEQSGVMPETWISQLYFCNKCGYTGNSSSHDGCNYAAAEAPRYTETMVREALAKMQARVEQLENLLLEAVDGECGKPTPSDVGDWIKRVDAALKGQQ